MAGVYNWTTQIDGDTLKGKSFILDYDPGNDTVKSLAGATVVMEIFRSKTSKVYLSLSSADGEITITNPATGEVSVLNKNLSAENQLAPGEYYYRLRVEYADGFKHTFLGGTYRITRIFDLLNETI